MLSTISRSWSDILPGQNNLWYQNSGADNVIVFVHGIFSESRMCWLSEQASTGSPRVFWPDLVRADPRFGDPDIFLGGFHTALDSGDYGVQQCADEVFSALGRTDESFLAGPMSRSTIVFVCHSTGGIVVRYLLTRRREAFRSKRVGVVLIASPSAGSRHANRLQLLARLYKHKLGLQLRWGDEMLVELDRQFRDLVTDKSIPGLFGEEACEHHFLVHSRFLPDRMIVVTPESAGQYFHAVRTLPGTNHFTAVKPTSLTHPAHQFLVDVWARHVESLTFSDSLLERLESQRARCERMGIQLRTSDLLLALLEPPTGFGRTCLDAVEPGLATAVFHSLANDADERNPRDPFRPMVWAKVPDVAEAARIQRAESAATVDDRHLLLAILRGTNQTVDKLRGRLTDDGYARLVRLVEQSRVSSHLRLPKRMQYVCVRARPEQLPLLRQFAATLIDADLLSVDTLRAWQERRPECHQLVFKIVRKEFGESRELVGFFSLVPITEEAKQELESNQLRGGRLQLKHIVGDGERPAAIYIGGVGARGIHARGQTLMLLKGFVAAWAQHGQTIYTRPVTDDGLRLVKDYDFEPVTRDGEPRNVIHRAAFTEA